MLAAKVADGGVVDGAARDEPHKIDRVCNFVFDDPKLL